MDFKSEIIQFKQQLFSAEFDFTLREDTVLNRNHDWDYYQYRFQKDGWVAIQNFLNNEKAELIYNYLNSNDMKWYYSIKTEQDGHLDILDTVENQVDIEYNKTLANKHFCDSKYLTYHFCKTISKHITGCHCLECNYNKFFKSTYLKSKISKVVNKEIHNTGEIFSSYYRSGDFLGKHSDKDNGQYAFVYQLSKNWDVTWGGNLHLLKDDWQEVDKLIVPKFNQMIIFSVENSIHPHFVSHISPNVPEKRLSIAGWYNSSQILPMSCS